MASLYVKLLVTTGLARWLDQDHAFLSDLASRLRTNEIDDTVVKLRELEISVAVVDRLPGPSISEPMGATATTDHLSQGIGGFYEGIAVKLWRSRAFSRDSPVVPKASPSPTRCIDFTHTIAGPPPHSYVRTALLQPANTLFVNGKEATMFRVNAILPKSRKAKVRFSPAEELDLLRIPDTMNGSESLNLPLIALTKPRRVCSGMGNVISSLENADTDEREMPASTELERAVSDFLGQRSTNSTEVFAFIEPKTANGMTPSDQSSNNLKWSEALRHGVLRKVTGGGGGWGNKRGLLSFDPSEHLSDAPDGSSAFGADDDTSNAITPIAQPGDTVQFFATLPNPPSKDEASRGSYDLQPTPKIQPRGTVTSVVTMLGKIPFTGDGGTAQPINQTSRWTMIPNLFGMLTERNMSLITVLPADSGLPQKLNTRLNVPYACLTYSFSFKKGNVSTKDQRSGLSGGDGADSNIARPRDISSSKWTRTKTFRKIVSSHVKMVKYPAKEGPKITQ